MRTAVGDGRLHVGSTEHEVVQHHGHSAVVFVGAAFGHLTPSHGAFAVHGHADHHIANLVVADACVHDALAAQFRFAFAGKVLDGKELGDVGRGLGFPKEAQVAAQGLTGCRLAQQVVHTVGVAGQGVAHHSRAASQLQLEDREEGVLGAELVLGQGRVCRRVFPKELGALCLGQSFVGGTEAADDFVVEERFPEFEVGCALQLLAGTLAVVDARQLHQDAAVLELLHVGLGHPELVDPLADDALGVVDGGLGLRTENFENLTVRAFRREEVLVLHVVEDAPQLHLRGALGPSTLEQRHKVVAGGLTQGLGIGQGAAEVRVVAVVGQGHDEVRQADFQGDAHAAFQVEAEVQLLFLDVAVGVTKHGVNLRGGAVAQELAGCLGRGFVEGLVSECACTLQGVGHVGSVFICRGFESTRHPVEGQGVQRRKGQQHSEDDKNVLILHDR